MIFTCLERFIGRRYLKSPRHEGFTSVIAAFSFIGIMLGVATLIVVMAVMNGFRHEFLTHIVGMNGHLWVSSVRGSITDYQDLQQKLTTIPGVKFALPTIERQAILTYRGQARGIAVHAFQEQDLPHLEAIHATLSDEGMKAFTGNHVFLGKRLAEKLAIRTGDRLSLMTPNGIASAFGSLPRSRTFEVAGVFEAGLNQFDQNVILMPMAAAQTFFELPARVTTLEITAHSVEDVSQVSLKIRESLPPEMTVTDWQQANAAFMQTVKTERNVMFLILSLIILIAAFNIISGLIMLVKDKTKDIAILRTMGVTRTSIMRTFFLMGATIGTIGTALGVGLGLLIGLNIESIRRFLEFVMGGDLFNEEFYFLSQLPARIEIMDIVHVIAMALTLSYLATLYPAWRAARLDPVEALRQ